MDVIPDLFPEFVAHNFDSVVNKNVPSLGRGEMKVPGGVKGVASTSHKH